MLIRALSCRMYVGQRQLRTPEYHDIRPVLLDGDFEVNVMLLDEPWNRSSRIFGEPSILAVAPTRDILACCPASSQADKTTVTDPVGQTTAYTYTCATYNVMDQPLSTTHPSVI